MSNVGLISILDEKTKVANLTSEAKNIFADNFRKGVQNARLEALKDPSAYITKRNAKVDNIYSAAEEIYAKAVQAYSSTYNLPDETARQFALRDAKHELDRQLGLLNLEYPESVLESASHLLSNKVIGEKGFNPYKSDGTVGRKSIRSSHKKRRHSKK